MTVLSSIYSKSQLLEMPPQQRINICAIILQNDDDESMRGEVIWVLGSTAKEVRRGDSAHKKIGDLLEQALIRDSNAVVKHEACFQLGENEFKEKISALIDSALFDPSELVRHEAIEALGLMKAFECDDMLQRCLKDENDAVRQTARFVIKQLSRLRSSVY